MVSLEQAQVINRCNNKNKKIFHTMSEALEVSFFNTRNEILLVNYNRKKI